MQYTNSSVQLVYTDQTYYMLVI